MIVRCQEANECVIVFSVQSYSVFFASRDLAIRSFNYVFFLVKHGFALMKHSNFSKSCVNHHTIVDNYTLGYIKQKEFKVNAMKYVRYIKNDESSN